MSSPPPRRHGRDPANSGRVAGGFDGFTGAIRGQSTALEYTLSLAIASLVVTGLFFAAGDLVTNQREQVIRTELGVVGQQLAGDVTAADRLVQAGNSTETLSINTSTPQTVAGAGYRIAVEDTGSTGWLNLTSQDPDVSVSIRVETETPLESGTVQGGGVDVVYNTDTDPEVLEVRG